MGMGFKEKQGDEILKGYRGWAIPLIFLLIWYMGSTLKIWNPYIIPSPIQTFETAVSLVKSGAFFHHALVSLSRVFIGFTVAFLLAFPLGIILGMNRRFNPYCEPILEFFRHVPPLALVPMIILWFGIGETSKIVIIVLASFFPIYLNTLNGVLNCDKKLIEVGKSFEFTKNQLFYRIILPATTPYIFVGMRLGLGYSWRALIGAEMIAAASGLGYMILDAQQLSRPDVIIVGILTIGILGSVIDYLFSKVTKNLRAWQEGGNEHGWG